MSSGLVRSIHINNDANCIIFKNNLGKEFTRLSVVHASSGMGPEQNFTVNERLLGIYGSFDEKHKFIKSLGVIVWIPPNLL
jgi:hypothetical protein